MWFTVVNSPTKNHSTEEDIDLKLDYDFNFLLISQYGPRKNIANTIKWFLSEFKDDEVGLVVKTNMAKNCHIDMIGTESKFRKILNDINDDASNRMVRTIRFLDRR